MIEPLLDFSGLLRRNGVRVSTAEVLDAARALEAVGLEDPELAREALAATLAKRPDDRVPFDELFDLYFFRPADARAAAAGSALGAALEAAGVDGRAAERILELVAQAAARLDPLARLGTGMGRGSLEPLLRLAGAQIDLQRMVNPLQTGYFWHRMMEAMGAADAEAALEALARRIGQELGEETGRKLAQVFGAKLAALRHAVREHVAAEFERRHRDFTARMMRETLLDKPFSRMSPEELVHLRAEVVRLAKKLRTQASLRRAVRRRGRLDAGKTIRRSLATGGIPFEIKRRRRRPERPRLVVLCDISDSVRHVSRFMLQLTHTLQDLFQRVRSFVFVADLGETTDLFSRADLDVAVDSAYAGAVISVYANSDFGRAFGQFRDRYLDAVTSKTTVIVIGDGRNNYRPTNAGALAAVRARAKRLLWLSPEPAALWGFGDSAMPDYAPLCDRIEVVTNLASLVAVIDDLVL